MPVDESLVGRYYPAQGSFVVGRESVRTFARAVGATHPHHHDVEAARTAGHADLVAPPTFAVVVAQPMTDRIVADPEVGIDYARVVHGEQSFIHHAPLLAGEEVRASLRVAAVRLAGPVAMITLRTEIETVAGEPRCTATAMLVHRTAEAPAQAPAPATPAAGT